jgi:hypothetical protein
MLTSGGKFPGRCAAGVVGKVGLPAYPWMEKPPEEGYTMDAKHVAVAVLAAGLAGLAPSLSATAACSPAVNEVTGFRHLSGGVGLEDRQRLEEMASDFDLKLVFAEPDGDYLADVPVMIEDGHGIVVLHATSRGPWFYAKLPPGRYTVAIPQAGAQYTRSVEVPRHGQKEVLIHLG